MSVYLYSSGTLVSSSATAISNATLSSGGTMTVFLASANHITVTSGGSMYVSSGGTATNVDWTPCVGDVRVDDEGIITYVSTYSGVYFGSDNQLLSHADTMTSQVVSGSMYVMSDGVASKTKVKSGGYMCIGGGGSANSTTVYSRGSMYVSSGGTATNVIWTPCEGDITIENGGYITYASAYSGIYFGSGNQLLSHADTMTSQVVSGSMYVMSGGMASKTKVRSDGYMYILDGGVADNSDIHSGSMHISSGGVANNTTLYHADMYIYDGGVANTVRADCYGDVRICSGGIANNVSCRTLIRISSGGIANNATMYINGYIYIENGGSANNTTLTDYSSMYICSGGTATNVMVSGGTIKVRGSVNSTTISSGGSMLIYSGGTATNVVWTPFEGDITIYNGGYVTYASSYSGVYFGSDNQLLSRADAMTGKVVSGSMYVMSGGVANSTTVNSGGTMFISSGGTANNTTISSGGSMRIYNEGSATNIVVHSGAILYITVASNTYVQGTYGGSTFVMRDAQISGYTVISDCQMSISSGGVANSTTVNSKGYLQVYSGGVASNTILSDNWAEMCIFNGGCAEYTSVNSCGYMYITSGGVANSTMVNTHGRMHISSGGTANNTILSGYCAGMRVSSGGIANNTTVSWSSYIYLFSSGVVNSTTVNSNGSVFISSGGVANSTTVNSNGKMYIRNGGVHRGSLQIESGAIVSAYTGAVVDFTLVGRTASDGYLINNIALVKGAPTYTITVSATQANGTYKLAQGAANFTGTLTVGDGTVDYGSITVNGDDLVYNGVTFSLDKANGNLTLTVSGATSGISNLQASATGASWSGNAEVVEYSKDNFATSLKLNTSGSAIDTYQTPAGAWQVRVDADAQASFAAATPGTAPAQLVSDADGNLDVFFAKTNTTWQGKNIAKHAGNLNGWTGTHERASITGKNKIEDIFAGSTDANVLVLTDDTNGDALFLDDIFSTFGNQARLSQIDEIRAGAGDDVVDLTSPKFAYVGDSMTVYGGSGNDTIWANSGSNTLYGDAGNDRLVGGNGNDFIIGGAGNDSMHGGGGNDTFCFGGNWGVDTVEQLASGKVILRFESGSLANWNATTQTYTAGNNSVTVTGTSDIELYFGADSTLPAGAFLSASSDKIFEDINSGMLA